VNHGIVKTFTMGITLECGSLPIRDALYDTIKEFNVDYIMMDFTYTMTLNWCIN